MSRPASAFAAALACLAILGTPLPAQEPSAPAAPTSSGGFDKTKLTFGGGLGGSFGDVDVIEIWPRVGYRFTPKWDAGVGLQFRYTNDDRYAEDFSATDYGVDLYTSYRVIPQLSADAEYRWLSYEYYDFDSDSERDTDGSLFLGGSFIQPMSKNAALMIGVLYNVTYDDNDALSPYDDPWIYRIGVTAGF
jgi:hypothetical protein